MKIIRSFAFAWSGLRYCFLTQTNFRIHLLFAALAILLGICFNISIPEWLALLLCIGSVLILELLNTAIERLCDVVQKDFHPGIKIIKDIAAGAVLVSALVSVCIGTVIFLPKIIHFIKPV